MTSGTMLGTRMNLDGGAYILPPQGWAQFGFVVNNPLRLLPQSRLRWRPNGLETVSLHWSLSRNALPARHMEILTELLSSEPGMVLLQRLKRLVPALIRMPVSSIIKSEVISYPRTWPLLRVEYDMMTAGYKGVVHYSPTHFFERGEYQILAYEGMEPNYSKFLPTALASMASLSLGT